MHQEDILYIIHVRLSYPVRKYPDDYTPPGYLAQSSRAAGPHHASAATLARERALAWWRAGHRAGSDRQADATCSPGEYTMMYGGQENFIIILLRTGRTQKIILVIAYMLTRGSEHRGPATVSTAGWRCGGSGAVTAAPLRPAKAAERERT